MLKQARITIGILISAVLICFSGCTGDQNTSTGEGQPAGPAPLADYGDAPDGEPTGYPDEFAQTGNFPTLFSSNGARTLDTEQAWLGHSVSAEQDATDPADPDGVPNLTNTDSDDGLTDFFITLVAIPPPTTLTVDVGAPAGSEGGTFFLNAIIDLNMDGKWGGRGINGESEWVVQNYRVQVVPGSTTAVTPPAFAFSNGNLIPDGAFMRLALTKDEVPANWDGTGEFSAGEIEDHFIRLPEIEEDDDTGKVDPPPLLNVDCDSPYKPGQMVTCIVTNRRNVAGAFTYTLHHTGTGTVGVPINTCNPPPPGGPLNIAPNGVVVITCNSRHGKAPDQWRFIAHVIDPPAYVVPGGIHLGHSDLSISDFDFEGDPKPMDVFLRLMSGWYQHMSGYSTVHVDFVIYGDDPVPVEGANVTMQMTYPNGSVETLTAETGPDGSGSLAFNINVYGDYLVEVVTIEGENMVYAPEMNVTDSVEVVVTGGASVPVVSGEIPLPELSYNIKSFISAFNTAFADADVEALMALLNPAVVERYGENACLTYLQSVVENTIEVEVVEVLSFGWWTWELDDLETEFDNVYTVLVNATAQGQTVEQEIHYAQLEDGTLTWFTDCGDPLP
jgi:hypothetical protein